MDTRGVDRWTLGGWGWTGGQYEGVDRWTQWGVDRWTLGGSGHVDNRGGGGQVDAREGVDRWTLGGVDRWTLVRRSDRRNGKGVMVVIHLSENS